MSGANTQGLIIERILRDRGGIWRQISQQRDLNPLNRQMLVTSVVSLAAYGVVLGASNSPAQAASSLFKLPLLFLATLAICLPTLYLFNLVFGARLSMSQAVSLIMVCITVTAVLTLAFAPISLFFLITARSYAFFKLLNVAILLLTATVGLRFLTAGMQALNDSLADSPEVVTGVPAQAVAASGVPAGSAAEQLTVAELANGRVVQPGQQPMVAEPAQLLMHPPVGDPAQLALQAERAARYAAMQAAVAAREQAGQQRSASMSLLYIWILLFGFVGTQLAWTLRPFFGSPDEPFAIFRHIGGTFYSDVLHTIGRLFGA